MRLAIAPELIQAARERDGEAMERLLQTFWPHAFRIARSIIHNDTLAEDAAQEACAIVYREIASLRSADAFRVWAYRIVARQSLRLAKRNAPAMPARDVPQPADIESSIDVLRALESLAPDLRAAVVLHYYADLSSSEIGAALGVPGATVRFRLAQARRRLESLLDAGERKAPNTAREVLL